MGTAKVGCMTLWDDRCIPGPPGKSESEYADSYRESCRDHCRDALLHSLLSTTKPVTVGYIQGCRGHYGDQHSDSF